MQDEKMKKTLIILGALLAFIFTGAFICIHQKSEDTEPITAKQKAMNQFPDPMPDLIWIQRLGSPYTRSLSEYHLYGGC